MLARHTLDSRLANRAFSTEISAAAIVLQIINLEHNLNEKLLLKSHVAVRKTQIIKISSIVAK